MTGKISVLLVSVSAVALAHAARADVEINNKPTGNMSCVSGVCTATAQKAVLNVTDLANMLASGDVAVKTGSVAKDIDVDQPLTWSNTSRLTLDAQQSVTVKKQVTVAGQGALTVITNDTGQPKSKSKTGEFIIVPEHGSVQFWDLGSSLVIDGQTYTLVGDIKTLAADIAANPSGFYALAKPYDASVDGTYSAAVVPTNFLGTFEGLGNTVSNLAFQFSPGGVPIYIGLFATIAEHGVVRDAHIKDGRVDGNTCEAGAFVGLLASINELGTIAYSSTDGVINITGGCGEDVGGLVAGNGGLISKSNSKVQITMNNAMGGMGGLVGTNGGMVVQSFSKGSLIASDDSMSFFGGLSRENLGVIANSFATNAVHQRKDCCGRGNSYGGLVGHNGDSGEVATSYDAGRMTRTHSADPSSSRGGVIGVDDASPGHLSKTYWNLDKGIGDPSQGAGNISNDPGLTGLTTQQLLSGLPAGFDAKIWGQDSRINRGLPYLLSNPPK